MNCGCLITLQDYQNYFDSLWFVRETNIQLVDNLTLEINLKSFFPLFRENFKDLMTKKGIGIYIIIQNEWLCGNRTIKL